MMNSLQDPLKRLRARPPLRPPLRPPDVTYVMNRTRPSAFFAALPHPCIIVNGNRRTEKNGVGLGTRLGVSYVDCIYYKFWSPDLLPIELSTGSHDLPNTGWHESANNCYVVDAYVCRYDIQHLYNDDGRIYASWLWLSKANTA